MLIPHAERVESPLAPKELFRALNRPGKMSLFLDSHDYAPPKQLYSYLAFSPFLEIRLTERALTVQGEISKRYPSRRPLERLRAVLRRYRYPCKTPYPFWTGGLAGYWAYEFAEHAEKIRFREKKGPQIPKMHLGAYRDLVVYDHRRRCYWAVSHGRVAGKQGLARGREEARRKAVVLAEKIRSVEKRYKPISGPRFRLKAFRPDIGRSDFEQIVRRAKAYIAAGDIYQANLSQRFSFRHTGSAFELYLRLRAINPSPFACFLQCGTLTIVSSSPERLVHKHGRFCETEPIAGTRPRFQKHKTEGQLARELAQSAKERAEHIMLVDLERNDLGRVCSWPTIRVRRLMGIEKYSHVQHLVSSVAGHLRRDCDGFDLIRAMFPGGTITGCPKVRCMQIIDELEPIRRGVYTGSVGYIDFKGDLDLNIVIRTIVLSGGRGYFHVGAGIVHDSKPRKEYEETLHKGEALREALMEREGRR